MKKKAVPLELEGDLWFHRADRKYLGGDRIKLLEQIDELGSITKAAKAVGISYKTAWDLVNMINNMAENPLVDRLTGGRGGGGTTLTTSGKKIIQQFRVVEEEHRKFLENLEQRLGDTDKLYDFLRRMSMKVSARNLFAGTITKVKKGAVNSEVCLCLTGGASLIAVVTNGAVDNLGLKEGVEAYAIVKSTSVILGDGLHEVNLSARNVMCGTVVNIIVGPVNTEVDLDVGGGNVLSAVITRSSGEDLQLSKGAHICAIFKASSVIVGVN